MHDILNKGAIPGEPKPLSDLFRSNSLTFLETIIT